MRTYDELLKDYKDIELDRENLELYIEELHDEINRYKYIISKAIHLNNHITEYDYRLFQDRMDDILRGVEDWDTFWNILPIQNI